MHHVGTILSDQFLCMHDLSVCSVYVIHHLKENVDQVCLVGVQLPSAARWCSE